MMAWELVLSAPLHPQSIFSSTAIVCTGRNFILLLPNVGWLFIPLIQVLWKKILCTAECVSEKGKTRPSYSIQTPSLHSHIYLIWGFATSDPQNTTRKIIYKKYTKCIKHMALKALYIHTGVLTYFSDIDLGPSWSVVELCWCLKSLDPLTCKLSVPSRANRTVTDVTQSKAMCHECVGALKQIVNTVIHDVLF